MKTKKVISSSTEDFQFGYWYIKEEEFVPLLTNEGEELDEFKKVFVDAKKFLDMLQINFASLQVAVSDDLRDIWKRLDEIEGK